MEQKRINPSEIFDRVQTEIKKWFRGFSEMDLMAFAKGEWIPRVDMAVEEDRVVVRADLPGFGPGDVDLTLRGDRLVLAGEKPPSDPEASPILSERKSGSFRRTLSLPFAVEETGASASMKNGVLEVVLRRKGTEEGGEIKIDVRTE
jgi:HSP20 family protein